jgi:hypothetical protein
MQGLEIFPWHRWSKQSKILFYIIKKILKKNDAEKKLTKRQTKNEEEECY